MDGIFEIIKRLDIARRKLGASHNDLGEILGISKSSVGSAFSRKSMKLAKIKLIATELNISYFWLTTGKGSMLVDITSTEILNDHRSPYNKVGCRKCVDKDIIIEHQNNVILTKNELITAKSEIINGLKRELDLLRIKTNK